MRKPKEDRLPPVDGKAKRLIRRLSKLSPIGNQRRSRLIMTAMYEQAEPEVREAMKRQMVCKLYRVLNIPIPEKYRAEDEALMSALRGIHPGADGDEEGTPRDRPGRDHPDEARAPDGADCDGGGETDGRIEGDA
jgi:hypothetical protein